MDIMRLIREIHRRSLWQVMAIYLGSSWVVLQVTQHVVDQFALPEWTYGAALMLLLLGLPVVLATAFVQEGPPRHDASPPADVPRRAAGPPVHPPGDWSHRLLTWRNAILGAVGAMSLWGVVAAGWLLVAPTQGREPEGPRHEPAELRAEDTASGQGELAAGADAPGTTTAGDSAAHPVRMADDSGTEPPRSEASAGLPHIRRSGDPGREAEVPRDDRALREHAGLLQAALSAGARARDAGAPERGLDLAVPDSLLEEGRRTDGPGGTARALRDLAGAQALYEDAARRAARGWRASADSAAAALEALREAADAGAGGYAEAERLRSEGRGAALAGDARTALDRYRAAAAGYRRATGGPEPATADEPSEQPAAEALPAARAAVVATLERLERALEAEDPAAVREVWVTMDGETERGFRSFFDRIRDFDVAIEVRWETLAATDDRATVTGLTTWSYYDEDRRERVTREPFEQGFELVRRDGAWVLVRY